jgi:ABC-type nitrate/sulfonate/bicarbonate transport systems, periplasmic components
MKRKLLALALSAAMVLGAAASGCASDPSSSGSASPSSSAASSAAAATSSTGTQKITLQLSWLPQSEFMGFYVAQEKGYYKDAGIDLNILPGGSNIIPEQQVSAGVADLGVTLTSSLMQYQNKGWGLQEVAQLFQKSAMLFVSKKSSGISSLADLKGKKIGCWFGGNEYELYALLTKAGLDKDKDVTLVQQDYTMDQVQSGGIDIAQAMSYNEYGLLLEAGYSADDLNTIDVNDEGVAMLEDCLFGSSDWMSKNKDLTVRFLKASIKGWADACDDPEAAGKIVYDKDKSISLEHQTYMAKEVGKLVVPSGFDKARIGYMDDAALKQTADLALKYGLLTKAADLSKCVDATYWDQATAS